MADAQPGIPKMTIFFPFQSLCVRIFELQARLHERKPGQGMA